jgi:DNA polymerase zeta
MDSLHRDKDDKKDSAYAVPTGTVFVSENVVRGVLPQVLDEMLSTRAMLKKAAKEYKKRVPNLSPSVLRQIEARQLALKYVANVTYGYTSATFSGRSAAPLVADAIVECGRRTLSNAITLANTWGKEERWKNAEVLYGDTDSIFIRLPGRSISEAFLFGEEFCQAVTQGNPPPVQLKLEKVYAACLLQTKKKYCGMMYESATQKRPVFEAKGIETVRRDQCKLTQRILRNALITVFERGIQAAREYLNEQYALIHSGSLPVSEFILTGRVRSRYRGGKIGPVQAALARRLAEIDPGRVVRHKERLPYVIVASPGMKFRLRENVLTPLELLEQWDSYRIHCAYYTTKHVNAALQRCFGLSPFKINIAAWYESWSPKPRMRIHYWPDSRSASCAMISKYFGSDICSLCDRRTKSKGKSRAVVCSSCQKDSVAAVCTALTRLNETQQQANTLAAICSDCNGLLEDSGSFAREVATSMKGGKMELSNPMANCVCIDCPITYKRHRLRESEIEVAELCKALNI